MSNKKLIVILGPTASGKTDLAIKLAKKFSAKGGPALGWNGVEVVSADSRQVYKEMDIGTAKITKKERQGIPHRLIDIVYPNQEFNVAIFKKLAVKAIKNIQKRGKTPFLVGGTGLYIWAVVANIKFPRIPGQKKLREKLEKKSTAELFKIYEKLDPRGAKFIEKQNKRRLIRAIEVCKITGKSFWEQRKKGKPLFEVLQIGIKIPKDGLKKKIARRVQKMFELGLEKEVNDLVKKYGWIPPFQTIGYQEWKEFFEGKISKNDVKNLIIQHTTQFAKKQMTWFSAHGGSASGGKRDSRIYWVKNYKEAGQIVRSFLF